VYVWGIEFSLYAFCWMDKCVLGELASDWDNLKMVASTTETCRWLSICNKIHFTKVHSLVYYTLQFKTWVWNILSLKTSSSVSRQNSVLVGYDAAAVGNPIKTWRGKVVSLFSKLDMSHNSQFLPRLLFCFRHNHTFKAILRFYK